MKGVPVFKMKARHWSLLAIGAAVVSIAIQPDPMDGFLIGFVAVLFWEIQEACND